MRLNATTALLVALLAGGAAAGRAASVARANELITEAREELEAVITDDDSTATDRTAARALLKRLSGEPAGSPPPRPSGELIDNGDGTASDAATGLMWALKDSVAPTTWEGAVSNCEGSKRGQHDDWRLPTWADLRSLITDKMAGKYRVSPLLQLSNCSPWVSNDDLDAPAFAEVDL